MQTVTLRRGLTGPDHEPPSYYEKPRGLRLLRLDDLTDALQEPEWDCGNATACESRNIVSVPKFPSPNDQEPTPMALRTQWK
mgnify:CR=1 FL=1